MPESDREQEAVDVLLCGVNVGFPGLAEAELPE